MDEEPWDAPLREREQWLEDQTNPPDLLAGWAVPSFVRTGVPMMHSPSPGGDDPSSPDDTPSKDGPGADGSGSGDADPDVGQEDGEGLGDGLREGLDALLDLLGGLFGGGEGGPIHRGPGWQFPDPPTPPPVDNAPPGLEKPDTPVSLPPGPVVVGDDNAIIVVLVPIGEAVAIGIGLTVGLGIGIGVEMVIDEIAGRRYWCRVQCDCKEKGTGATSHGPVAFGDTCAEAYSAAIMCPRGSHARHCNCNDSNGWIGTGGQCASKTDTR
jgi:hypothetical protein